MTHTIVPVTAVRLFLLTVPALKTTFMPPKPKLPKLFGRHTYFLERHIRLMEPKFTLNLPKMPGVEDNVMPPGWTFSDIATAFQDANEIWMREAQIEFRIVHHVDHRLVVSEDPDQMWIDIINGLPALPGKVKCSFVHDLHENEGGWGGGRYTVVSFAKAMAGLPKHGGAILAHELGHVLMDDVDHLMAKDDDQNLMHAALSGKHAINYKLNNEQKALAARKVTSL